MTLNFDANYPNVAKISRAALRSNFQIFKRLCGAGVKICPAVKANAYGHGVEIVAPVLAEAGADMFAVANLAEAQELAGIVPAVPILVFSPLQGDSSDKEALLDAVRAVFHLTVADIDGAGAIAAASKKQGIIGRVQIKVDTGMGRMGVSPEAAVELTKYVCGEPALKLEGLYTHFASADEADASFAAEQLGCFNEFLQAAQEITGEVPLIHAANSAALLRMRESHLSMVRPGISTYGYWPSEAMAGIKALADLQPIMRVESRVVLVKDLPAGHTCGYGRTFRAHRPTRVGIVPIGYDDGYRRLFSNRTVMQVGGKDVPVVGRVSMDQTILDLTDTPQVQPGDTVTVISEYREAPNSVEKLAEIARTIPHEISCLLGRRIKRQAV